MRPKPKATWWMETRWRLHQMRHTNPLTWLLRARGTSWVTAIGLLLSLSPFVVAVTLWLLLGEAWDLVREVRYDQRRWMLDQCDKRGWFYDHKHDPQWVIDFRAELDAWREETRPRRGGGVRTVRATGIKSVFCEDTGEVIPWPPEDMEL